MTFPDRPGGPAAIVTGVSRGLGAALATELLERGFMVVGIGRTGNPALTGQNYRHLHRIRPWRSPGSRTRVFYRRDVRASRPGLVT